jgi:Arylsulfotransferase (ASST)
LGRLLALTISGVVALTGAGVGIWLGLDSGSGKSSIVAEPPSLQFHTRPDLKPTPITILHPATDTAPGLIFLAPKKDVSQEGPMIIDNSGQLVWFDSLKTSSVTDFKEQRYKGKPVLTWWQGQVENGHGGAGGAYAIMDSSYHLIKYVRAVGGLSGDIHDFQLTRRGTAVFTVYHKVPYDLSSLGGPKDGFLLEGVIQEVSVATGRLLFQWHSLDHVPPTDSFEPLDKGVGTDKTAYDYFHINSVQVDTDGNFIVSSRHTSTVFKVRRKDGAILWRLGGKHSDFTFGPGTRFGWQHDARMHANGVLSIFNNNGHMEQKNVQSSGLVLKLNFATHHVTLVHAYHHSPPLLSTSQGDTEFLPDGHVFVGWGGNPYFTEYTASGQVLLDGRIDGPKVDSYRSFRFTWVGKPTTKPAVAVAKAADGTPTVYASWNGATKVVQWQVLTGPDPQHLHPAATAAKNGFETAIALPSPDKYVAVRALESKGGPLATSPAIRSGS